MKKIMFIVLALSIMGSITSGPTFPANPFKTEEADAGVFDLKTDSSTTGTGLFKTKSYNDRYPRNTRGY